MAQGQSKEMFRLHVAVMWTVSDFPPSVICMAIVCITTELVQFVVQIVYNINYLMLASIALCTTNDSQSEVTGCEKTRFPFMGVQKCVQHPEG